MIVRRGEEEEKKENKTDWPYGFTVLEIENSTALSFCSRLSGSAHAFSKQICFSPDRPSLREVKQNSTNFKKLIILIVWKLEQFEFAHLFFHDAM